MEYKITFNGLLLEEPKFKDNYKFCNPDYNYKTISANRRTEQSIFQELSPIQAYTYGVLNQTPVIRYNYTYIKVRFTTSEDILADATIGYKDGSYAYIGAKFWPKPFVPDERLNLGPNEYVNERAELVYQQQRKTHRDFWASWYVCLKNDRSRKIYVDNYPEALALLAV